MLAAGASYPKRRSNHMIEISQMAQWVLVVLVLSYVVYTIAKGFFG